MRPESLVKPIKVGLAETTPTHEDAKPTSPQSIQRKPVPRRGTCDSKPNFSMPVESRRSQPHSRTMSRQSNNANSQAELMSQHPNGTSNEKSEGMPSLPQDSSSRLSFYARPSTAQTTIMANERVSRSESRSQSATVMHERNDSVDREPSIDISRPGSRGRSIDSFRSAVSAISSSAESSTKKWKVWSTRRRSKDSQRSLESSGPTTSTSTHVPSAIIPPSCSLPPKPKINLNRELPPLPSLDQWKPDDLIVTVGEDEVEVPPSKLQSFPVRKESLRNRKLRGAVQHQTSTSSPGFPTLQTTKSDYFTTEPSQYYDQHLAPTTTVQPDVLRPTKSRHSPEPRPPHRRSHTATDTVSKGLNKQMAATTLDCTACDKPLPARKLASTTSTPMMARDKRLSYNVSNSADALNFSRKLSTDDYNRMYDNRYQNMLEVMPSPGSVGSGKRSAPPVPPKDGEKVKRKWWRGKPKREQTWMDAVVKSGSRSGVLLTDEVAGAPIVRY